MELLWYDIRQLNEETMAQTMAMMDEARRRRVGDIAGEDDRKRTVAAGPQLVQRFFYTAPDQFLELTLDYFLV